MGLDFKDALLSVYREKPCQVLPNALWKSMKRVDQMKTECECVDDEIVELKMHDEEALHLYWTKDRERFDLNSGYLEDIGFALIHADYIDYVPIDSFSNVQRYFRMFLEPGKTSSSISERYSIEDVNIDSEAEKISELIGRCYQDISPTPEEVRSWEEHPVFDDNLWVWMMDEREETRAGLGVGEMDKSVPEASLEWIQILPEYHGEGLGKALVHELVQRAKDRVDMITVAGEYDTEKNPKGFYERCGFSGDDIWYVLRKKGKI